MIIEHNESKVTTIGDIEKNQVSIDPRNINHIVTILSSNLYSNPIESFLRETISNAIDSHTEAGTKEPIVMTIADSYVAIRDYGTGISPEKFRDIYLNIGSSTKRESNDYIGSFGIGRFSSLSVSKLVNVTSYYNGKAYYYLMLKDLDKLSIDLINTIDTEEANGVEVKVAINNPEQFINTLMHLNFIPNIYVDCKTNASKYYLIEQFNKRKIFKYKTFKHCSFSTRSYTNYDIFEVLIGNILYVVDASKIKFLSNCDYEAKRVFKNIKPQLNIGDVDVTPNREQLLYSTKTIKAIEEAYNKAKDEIVEMVRIKYNKDYNNLIDYLIDDYTKDGREITIGEENFTLRNHNYILCRSDIHGIYSKVPNTNISLYKDILSKLCRIDTKFILYKNKDEISRSKYNEVTILDALRGKLKGYYYDREKISCKLLVVPSAKGLSSKYLKDYLNKYYLGNYVAIENMVHNLREQFEDLNPNYDKLSKSDKSIVLGLWHHYLKDIKKYIVVEDIMHSTKYLQFKKDNSTAKPKTYDRELSWYNTTFRGGYNNSIRYTDKSLKDALDCFKRHNPKKLYLYSIYDDPRLSIIANIVKQNTVACFSVAKTNKKVLEFMPKNFISIDDYLAKHKNTLIDIATLNSLEGMSFSKVLNNSTVIKNFTEYLPSNIKQRVYAFFAYCNKKCYAVKKEDIKERNQDIIDDFNLILKIVNIIEELKLCLDINGTPSLLEAYIGFKNKRFRMNYKQFKRITNKINFDK